tara:strand:- start:18 stop:455 length:438 start_codon:yes stop_codon:yes gene_type:complete
MKYNFYLYIILLSVISSAIGFLYKNILKDCSIFQEVFITNFILLFLSGIYCYYNEKNNNILVNKLLNNERNILLKVILYALIVASMIYISGVLVINENLSKIEPFKQGSKLLLITLFSYLFFNEKITWRLMTGSVFIVFGILLMK